MLEWKSLRQSRCSVASGETIQRLTAPGFFAVTPVKRGGQPHGIRCGAAGRSASRALHGDACEVKTSYASGCMAPSGASVLHFISALHKRHFAAMISAIHNFVSALRGLFTSDASQLLHSE